MKRNFLVELFTGSSDPDDTLRRIRKELARRRSQRGPRRDLMAVLAGSTDVQAFFRDLTSNRRR